MTVLILDTAGQKRRFFRLARASGGRLVRCLALAAVGASAAIAGAGDSENRDTQHAEGTAAAGSAFELDDAQRADLKSRLSTRALQAEHLGYAADGTDTVGPRCLVGVIPDRPQGEVSVCGLKDFMFDEVRRFKDPDGQPYDVRCAATAVLEMVDSPVHVHAATLEYYVVLDGSGRMVLGAGDEERVVEVSKGSIILLPPGQPHGIASDDPNVPIKALLTFTPGLAPKQEPRYRDEKILYERASERIRQLSEGTDSQE